MTSLCRLLNCLPEAGGLYDQDPDLMQKMKLTLSIMEEKAEQDRDRKRRASKSP